MTIEQFLAEEARTDVNDHFEEKIKLDLVWMREHHPIFKKMESETKQRIESESEYKKLLVKL